MIQIALLAHAIYLDVLVVPFPGRRAAHCRHSHANDSCNWSHYSSINFLLSQAGDDNDCARKKLLHFGRDPPAAAVVKWQSDKGSSRRIGRAQQVKTDDLAEWLLLLLFENRSEARVLPSIDHRVRRWSDRLIAGIYLTRTGFPLSIESCGTGFGSEESAEVVGFISSNEQLHHMSKHFSFCDTFGSSSASSSFRQVHLAIHGELFILLSESCPKTSRKAEPTNGSSAQNSADLYLASPLSSQHCCTVDRSAMIGRK